MLENGQRGTRPECGTRHCGCPCRNPNVEPLSSWLSLAAVVFIHVVIAIALIAFSVLYDPFVEKFDAHRSTIGWIESIYLSTGSLCALVHSPFIQMYGCRVVGFASAIIFAVGTSLSSLAPNVPSVIVSYGILGGFGYGGMELATTTSVQHSFSYNRGLATGISAMGYTLGTLIGPIFTEFCLRQFSLFGALLLQGGLCVQVMLFAMFLNSQPAPPKSRFTKEMNTVEESSKKTMNDLDCNEEDSSVSTHHVLIDETNCAHNCHNDCSVSISKGEINTQNSQIDNRQQSSTVKSIFRGMVDFSQLKIPTFTLYLIGNTFLTASKFGFMSQAVGAALGRGMSSKDAARVVSLIGIGNAVLRIMTTGLMNFQWMNPIVFTIVGILLLSTSAFLIAYAKTFVMFAVAMILMGCFEGIYNTVIPLNVVFIIGVDQFARAFSIVRLSFLPGSFVATPVTGWLFDISGDYVYSFCAVSGTALISCAMIIVVYISSKRHQI